MQSRIVGVAAVLAMATAWAAPGQPVLGPSAGGTASISGRVTDDLGMPVEGAEVSLSDPDRRHTITSRTTGADGRYRFDRLADGRYGVSVRHARLVSIAFFDLSSLPLFTKTAVVVPDQHLGDLHFAIPRAGRIRGRVVDHHGRPVAGVSVGVGRVIGGRYIRAAMSFSLGTDPRNKLEGFGRTGPDGVYQVGGLPAGDMMLDAMPPPRNPSQSAAVVYSQTFYPNAPTPNLAALVHVEADAVTENVEVVLASVVLGTLHVRLTPIPSTLTDLQMHVVAFPGKQIRTVRGPMLSDGGLAKVPELKEGRYAVWARGREGPATLAGFLMVDFQQDSIEQTLVLEPAGRITGRVIAYRGGVPPVEGLRIESALAYGEETIDPLAVDATTAGADGRFTLEGQFGLRRLSVAGVPDGWRLREITLGRSDVTEAGVEVAAGQTIDVVIVLEAR